MDRRQKKSRESIVEAFNTLLSQKKYADITVQDIIDLADVGRSTFYAHFETKDALLRELCDSLFTHVISAHSEAEQTHDFSGNADSADSVITHILYHLRDNSHHFVDILREESNGLFLQYFRQYLTVVFRKELNGKLKKINVPEDYLYHHISCSFIDTLKWWIDNDMKESPEKVEKYFRNVMSAIY